MDFFFSTSFGLDYSLTICLVFVDFEQASDTPSSLWGLQAATACTLPGTEVGGSPPVAGLEPPEQLGP